MGEQAQFKASVMKAPPLAKAGMPKPPPKAVPPRKRDAPLMTAMPKRHNMKKHKQVLMKAESKAPSMASTKRALLAKAATSKAAAWGTRATSKAPAMAPTLSKAGALVGATARRFQKGFSKAAAVARSDVSIFGGKEFAVPPWRGGKAVPKAKSMDDDYDPFSEQPAPHVEMEKVFRKAARKAAGDGQDAVEWRPQGDPLLGVVRLPPWRRKAAPKANLAPSQPKRRAAPRPRNAQAWLRRPRNNQGGMAEEYFQKEEKQPEKKQKIEAKRGFVKELLDKAPSTLQTCRSLLLFLDKKAEAVPEKPPVRGPEVLQGRLEAHAESLGRLEGLRTPGGWDARAKRVLDINATAASPPGEAALSALEKVLEKETKDLQKQLKDGEKLSDLLKERQAWAKETVRRDWIAWCAKLLRVRERELLGEKDEAPDQMLMTAVDVLEALVAGTTT